MTDPFAKPTQVGPGSPTGEFFRQFWLPIARSSEFVEATEGVAA